MFFQSLAELLSHTNGITLWLCPAPNGEITVAVKPMPKQGDDSTLSTPMTLTGTPAELDEQFATHLQGFSAARQSLAEQLETTKAVLEAAKKDSQSKATKAVTGKGKTSSTPEPNLEGGADEDGSGQPTQDATHGDTSQAAQQPAAASSAEDLWN